MVLIAKSRNIPEICRLTFQRIEGKITQTELESRVRQVLHPEDELPLGIGVMTKTGSKKRNKIRAFYRRGRRGGARRGGQRL